MDFLVNDLSFHGQFPDIPTFRDAIRRMMAMRLSVRRSGRNLYCHKNIASAQITSSMIMPQAVQSFSRDEQLALMQWLTKHGPFWEELRLHSSNDYLECRGNVVTDTAVGEAAYCCFHGLDRRLVSVSPSSWDFSPASVTWIADAADAKSIDVINYWDLRQLDADLQAAPTPLASWEQLERTARGRCENLTISATAFEPLQGVPFNYGAAQRILTLLQILERFKGSGGRQTADGQHIHEVYFRGAKPWFTDSSDSEKNEFRSELHFKNPAAENEDLFCPWHGKVKTPQLRIHFSWPVHADQPLCVVYIGPKITKR